MLPAQLPKIVTIVPPQAIKDNASWTTAEIDTAGFHYMAIYFHLGATDIAMSALAVTESDTTGTDHANVTGLIWGTSTNLAGSTSALPSATDDNTFQVALIDLRYRKRYIDVTATAGNGTAGTYGCCFALLWAADQSPNTTAELGANEVLYA